MLDTAVVAERLTPAHHALLSRARGFFTADRLAGWECGDGGPLTARAWRELAGAGLLGVAVPAEFGGQGLGILGSLVLSEAMAGLGDVGVPLAMHVQNDVACLWLVDANPELRDRYLPGLLDGTLVACQCDTDPSEDEPVVAERDGDEIVVRGDKLFVINGAGANLCFVRAQLDGAPTIVAVAKETPGVLVTKVYDKLGTRTVDSARVSFANARVPATYALSGSGVEQLMRWNHVMSRMRFLIAVDAYLVHRRMLARVLRYGGERRLGRRALTEWPVNGHALARARADLELMAASIARLVTKLDDGVPCVPELAGLKWFCVERACALARLCCDLEGGGGYMWDSASLHDYAQLRGLRMAGGSQTTMLTIANHSYACRAELELPALSGVAGGRHE